MPRDPAMYIRLSDFTDILASNGIKNPQALAMRIFTQAVPKNIKNRYVVTGDKPTREKANKIIQAASTSDMTVQRFNRILDAERRKAGHRHLHPIRKGDSNYLQLREIAHMAVEFCHSVGIVNLDEGCAMYIQIGLEKMKRGSQYALGKFKYYDAAIYQLYESYDTIANDPEKSITKQAHDLYVHMLAEYAGIGRDDLQQPVNYVCFIFCRLEAERLQADLEQFIEAQFEMLSKSFEAIPNPSQLFGDWAVKRYYEYVNKPKPKGDDIVVFKYHDSRDDFMAKYESNLRDKFAKK